MIVDSKDNIIGHKPRRTVDPKRDIYRSSCLWLENNSGEVLLAQRSFGKDKDPGLWGPSAGGTVDEGETYEINVYKEAEEEIGLTGVKFKLVTKIWRGIPRKHFIQIYTAVADIKLEDFKIQVKEVEKIAWVAKTDLLVRYKTQPEIYVSSMPNLIDIFIKHKL